MIRHPELNVSPISEYEDIEQLREHAVYGPILRRAEAIAHGAPTQQSTPNPEVTDV